jgi:hypothetical protein
LRFFLFFFLSAHNTQHNTPPGTRLNTHNNTATLHALLKFPTYTPLYYQGTYCAFDTTPGLPSSSNTNRDLPAVPNVLFSMLVHGSGDLRTSNHSFAFVLALPLLPVSKPQLEPFLRHVCSDVSMQLHAIRI